MKKILIVLAILIPVAVLAQGLPNLFIDGDNASIIAKSGQALKLGSQGASGGVWGVSGTTEMTLDNSNLTLPTNDIVLTAGKVVYPVAVATAGGVMTKPIIVVTDADATKTVQLYDVAVGGELKVVGARATPAAINILPPSGQVINGLSANALVPCAAGADCTCVKTAASATPASNTWACSVN